MTPPLRCGVSRAVHVKDLADVFRRVLASGSPRGYYVVDNGQNLTVADGVVCHG